MRRFLLAALLVISVACAQAAVGVTRVAPVESVTVIYPTSSPEATIQRGPFTLSLDRRIAAFFARRLLQ